MHVPVELICWHRGQADGPPETIRDVFVWVEHSLAGELDVWLEQHPVERDHLDSLPIPEAKRLAREVLPVTLQEAMDDVLSLSLDKVLQGRARGRRVITAGGIDRHPTLSQLRQVEREPQTARAHEALRCGTCGLTERLDARDLQRVLRWAAEHGEPQLPLSGIRRILGTID